MIKDKAPVTLYVVTHNYTRFLRAALESVDAQSWRPNQLIIIDNGSTDGVEEVLRDYTGREDVTIIHNSNIGHVKAANQALKLATEKYFMRLDGDDILMTWAIEYLVTAMEAESDAAYCFGDYITINEGGSFLAYHKAITFKSPNSFLYCPKILNKLYYWCFFYNESNSDWNLHGAITLFRVSLLARLGGISPLININDGNYLRDLFINYKLIYIEKFLFLYRRHFSNLTNFI